MLRLMTVINSTSGTRITFVEGDVIQYQHDNIGLIQSIFIYEMYEGIERIFFLVNPTFSDRQAADPILGLPIIRINRGDEVIVGLPIVEGKKQYTVQLPPEQDPRTTGQDKAYEYLIHCTWNVEFF